ncbi:MAG: plasmid stabilization protein [Spirochaetaceae bacterium]|nr:MAG: plasmid stabilization protein [Spirochaetaceae bacterium]
MRSLHIRDVGEPVLERLRRLAALHHRSLQGEVRAILEEASRRAPCDGEGDGLDLVTVETGRDDAWSREALYGDDAR